jgi:hypothetical protein
MTWVRLEDSFPDNAKVDGLSDGAFRLYVASICHSARELTDGYIATARPRRLVPHFKTRHIEELVAAGLWKVAGRSPGVQSSGGWKVNDYLEYNPAASTVLAERKQAAERMRAYRSGERTANVRAKFERSSLSPSRPDPYRVGGRSVVVTPSNGTAAPPQAAAAPLGCENCTSGWVYLADKVVTPCPTCRPENP